MIIEFDFDYPPCHKSILVKIEWAECVQIIDLSKKIKTLKLLADLPLYDQTVNVKISCADLDIVKYPVTITNIVLDNFYQLPHIIFKGRPLFDQQFVMYAKQNGIHVDTNINDHNRLDFTGTLEYQFQWPFYKNVFL